jgi:hypothetical protein
MGIDGLDTVVGGVSRATELVVLLLKRPVSLRQVSIMCSGKLTVVSPRVCCNARIALSRSVCAVVRRSKEDVPGNIAGVGCQSTVSVIRSLLVSVTHTRSRSSK